MKKKKQRRRRLILLIVIALLLVVVYRLVIAPQRDGIAARYREREISWTQVEQLRSVLSLTGRTDGLDDRTLVDRILLGYIVADEAKALGLRVGRSELVTQLKELPLPADRSGLGDYLRELGRCFHDWLELTAQQARSARLLDRLQDEMARDYCREHGIDPDLDKLPEEVARAVSERIDGLLASHRDEIEYYF